MLLEIIKLIVQSLIFPIIVASTISIIKSNESTRKTFKEETQLIKEGVQASLRHQLLSLWYKWSQEGYAPYEIKANFENIYEKYHKLGANGVMDVYREKFMALPDNK